MERIFELEIGQADEGQLVKQLLHERLMLPSKMIKRLKMREKGIMLDGRRVFVTEKVTAGDVIHCGLL